MIICAVLISISNFLLISFSDSISAMNQLIITDFSVNTAQNI